MNALKDFLGPLTMPANLGPADQLAWLILFCLKLAVLVGAVLAAAFVCLYIVCGVFLALSEAWKHLEEWCDGLFCEKDKK